MRRRRVGLVGHGYADHNDSCANNDNVDRFDNNHDNNHDNNNDNDNDADNNDVGCGSIHFRHFSRKEGT